MWDIIPAWFPVRSFPTPVEPSAVRDPLWGQNCRATSLCHPGVLPSARSPTNPTLNLHQSRSPRVCHPRGDSPSTTTSPGTSKSCSPHSKVLAGPFQAGSLVLELYGLRTFLPPARAGIFPLQPQDSSLGCGWFITPFTGLCGWIDTSPSLNCELAAIKGRSL